MTSSHVMLAEVVHSVADFANQVSCDVICKNVLLISSTMQFILALMNDEHEEANACQCCRRFLLMVLLAQGVHPMLCIREYSHNKYFH